MGGQDEGIPVKDVEQLQAALKKLGKSDPKTHRPADAKDADERTVAFVAGVLRAK